MQLVEHQQTHGSREQLAYAFSELGYVFLNLQPSRGQAYLRKAVELVGGPEANADAARWASQADFTRGLATDRQGDSGYYCAVPEIVDEESAYAASVTVATNLQNGEWEKASVSAAAVADWARRNKDHRLEAQARAHLGVALASLERKSEAIKEMRTATSIAARLQDTTLEIGANWNLARVLYSTGKIRESVEVAWYGITVAHVAASRATSTEVARLVAVASLPLYEHVVLAVGQVDHADNHFEIIRSTEQARARNLQGWLAASAIAAESPPGTDETSEGNVHDALLTWRAAETEIEIRHIDRSLTVARSRELEALKINARRVVDSQKRGPNGVLSSEVFHPRATNELLESVVNTDVALLTLFTIPEGVAPVLFWRSSDRLRSAGSIVTWAKHERDEVFADWADTSSHLRDDLVVGREHRGTPRDRFSYRKLMTRAKRKLFSVLSDLVERTTATRLVVVPHRELALLPYWDILDRSTTIRSLVLAPSVGAFLMCDRRPTLKPNSLLVVGDATGTLNLANLEAEHLCSLEWDHAPVTPKAHNELLTQAASCSVLHFASHGVYDSSNPYHSGIVTFPNENHTGVFTSYVEIPSLEPTDCHGPSSVRLLSVAEIMAQLQLSNCALVFLSSCESGIASTDKSGELTGIPAGMLVAGAKSVVASLWPVHDAACAVLSMLFYESWGPGSPGTLDVGAALADARVRLKQISRNEIFARLGRTDISLPDGEHPFRSGFYSDAFHCFGAG